MRIFLMIVSFIVFFLFFQFEGMEWFTGLHAIKAFFSLAIAAILVVVGFGIIDVFLPGNKND